MTAVPRDENRVTVMSAISNADGSTIVPIQADPASHALAVDNGVGGVDLSGDNAGRDENFVPVFMAVSATDGVTPVPVYGDPATGKILIRST